MQRLVLKNNDNLTLRPTAYALPDAYQAVEYLQSSGTEYINIGIYPKLDTDEFYFKAGCAIGTYFIVGSYPDSTYKLSVSNNGQRDALNYATLAYYSTIVRNAIQLNDGLAHEYIFKDYEFIVDETSIGTVTAVSRDLSSYKIGFGLFAYGMANDVFTCTNAMFINEFIYYRNGEEARHMYPCYRKSDNVAGMYDSVEGVFYTNAGTGTFTVGPNVANPVISGTFSDQVMHTLQSMLISNCPLIDSIGVLDGLYGQSTGQGVANNLLANFYLQWTGVKEKDATVLTMLSQIAQNKAVDGTTRVFHGMKLADGTVDDSIAPVIDGDLKMTGGIYMTSLDALGVDPSETEDYGEGLKRAFAHHFRDLRVIYDPNNMFIEFADPEVLRIALANWDTDHDGGISTGEAQAVGSMSGNGPFGGNTIIETFDELRYFTGMTYISGRNVSGTPAPFKNCTSLKRIIIPEGVLNVGMNTFNGCTALEEITFPASLQRIGYELATTTARNNAFTNCAAITKINYSGTPSQWGAILFGASNIQMNHPNTGGNATIYFDGQPLTEITINNDVSFGAFYKFTQFTSVVFGEGCTSIGSYAFEGDAALESIELQEGVTSIGQYAFQNCKKVKKLVLPSTITNLRAGCFNYCGYDVPEDEIVPLDIELPNLSTAGGPQNFQYCLLVRSVVSLGNLTAIPQQFFNFCSNLVSAVISEKVVSLGNNAFAGCTKLKSLDFKGVVPPTMGNTPFYQVPNGGVMTVPAGAYFNYQNLDSNWGNVRNWTLVEHYAEDGKVYVTFNITSTGPQWIFYTGRESYLTSVELLTSNGWEEIAIASTYDFQDIGVYTFRYLINSNIGEADSNLFRGCPDGVIKNINFGRGICFNNSGGGVRYLDDVVIKPGTKPGLAYVGCTTAYIFNLRDYLVNAATFQHSVFRYGNKAHHLFLNGKEITELVIPDDVTSIPAYAFHYCQSITSVDITNGVTVISSDAFRYCTSLRTLSLPSTLTTIAIRGFEICSGLTTLTLPEGLETLSDYVFRSCSSLQSVSIPSTITSIGSMVFAYCTNLASVYCYATTPPSLGTNAFNSDKNLTAIYVPAASVSAYKAATNWSAMASIIQAIPE